MCTHTNAHTQPHPTPLFQTHVPKEPVTTCPTPTRSRAAWPRALSIPSLIFTVTFSQPPQFKLDPRLARLLGLHTQSRSAIVQALWQYVKTNRLQDSHDKEYINGDKYFQQVA